MSVHLHVYIYDNDINININISFCIPYHTIPFCAHIYKSFQINVFIAYKTTFIVFIYTLMVFKVKRTQPGSRIEFKKNTVTFELVL